MVVSQPGFGGQYGPDYPAFENFFYFLFRIHVLFDLSLVKQR